MDDRTSVISILEDHLDASSISTLQANFREEVIARDKTCMMTGASAPKGIDACHIIPHAKGNQVRSINVPWDHFKFLFWAKYMINLVNYRNERYFEPLNRPLNDINDTRNGILLSILLHPFFGAFHFAFLRVSYLF